MNPALLLAVGAAGLALGRRRRGSGTILGPRKYVVGKGLVDLPTPSLEDVLAAVQAAEADEGVVVLYHSGDDSIAKQIHDGLEPTLGDFVAESLRSATDDDELIDKIMDGARGVAYLDDTPTWVELKAARAMGKPYAQITREDVRRHGHLAIFIVDADAEDILYASEPMEERFSTPGRTADFHPWHETPLHDYDDRPSVPFGVEEGDYFTPSALMPDYTLTGDALVGFLEARGFSPGRAGSAGRVPRWVEELSTSFALPPYGDQVKRAGLLTALEASADASRRRAALVDQLTASVAAELVQNRPGAVGRVRAGIARMGSFNDTLQLQDLAQVERSFPGADFWLQSKGTRKSVGRVWRTFKQTANRFGVPATHATATDIGIKIKPAFRQRVDPSYLAYVFRYLHRRGAWRNSPGTTALVSIRIRMLREVPLRLSE